eukprot:PhF_6_TR26993/c0_g1_i2/m.39400
MNFIALSLLLFISYSSFVNAQCPTPNYFMIQTHVGAGKSVTMPIDFNTSSIVRIDCISGVIWDVLTGHPSFTLTLEAPAANLVYPLLSAQGNTTTGVSRCNTSWCINAALFVQYTTAPNPPAQWLVRFTNKNSLWNADVNLTFSISEYGIGPAPTPGSGCKGGCTPNGTLPLSECNWYLTSPDATWVPRNYGEAAACACTLANIPGSMSATAMCVRNRIHAFHVGTTYFTAAMKAQLLVLKQTYCTGGASGDMFCSPKYYSALDGMSFPTIAHDLHQAAYNACCCPHPVAPVAAWWGIMVGGWATAAVCSVEVALIETVGSCGCDG